MRRYVFIKGLALVLRMLEKTKFKAYLVQVAKGFKLGLLMLIPMVLADYWSGDFNGEDLMLWLMFTVGTIPAFIFMTLAYALLEITEFHKFTRSLLWSLTSAIVIVTLIAITGFFAPPFMDFTKYTRYVALFTGLLTAIYYQLPWKEEC
jgi:hypothetical protein